MTTISDYRPEVAAAIADGSLDVGLSDDTRAELQRIHERMVALVTPMTRVVSASEAQTLAASGEAEYLRLAEVWSEVLMHSGFTLPQTDDVDAALYEVHLPDAHYEEQWQGTLQSARAYLEWAMRLDRRLDSNEDTTKDELLRLDGLFSALHGPWGRYVMADLAIRLVLAEAPGSSPTAIPALTELADNCMTEVEDVFLAEEDYSKDDGQTVSLANIRANLGL